METTTASPIPFAVLRTGGKQYRVSPGAKIRVEKLLQNAGDEIRFSDVLLMKNGDQVQVGAPLVAGATVVGRILRQFRDKKIIVFKKRSKKGYKKLQGHRQSLTEVLIESFEGAMPPGAVN
jgi:large subunit ribosomal protein L21